MNGSQISLKPVCDLLVNSDGNPTQFWIPAYQRGFRWRAPQVTQLLDDIWEFIQSGQGSFYCLQPIVIKDAKEYGDYEVVDGQQRLTTIYILLTYLSKQLEALEKERFKIGFQTRSETSEFFLEHIDCSQAEENIDFFHICEAHKAIENWFSTRDTGYKIEFLQHLLRTDEIGQNVKVIWFELADSDDPVSVFTRLNVGKIPLTNDELIRALFLRRTQKNSKELKESQIRVASEWDDLKKELQVDEFWYFLNKFTNSGENRMSFLFQLAAEAKENTTQEYKKDDPYWLFYVYSEILKRNDIEDEWLRIKQVFMSLHEWYTDRELYHLVGFLIEGGVGVSEIQKWSQIGKKSEFKRKLIEEIFIGLFDRNLKDLDQEELNDIVCTEINDVQYGYQNQKIRLILLLFNVAVHLENKQSRIRFSFDLYKRENWDIEHIRSVASKRPQRHDDRVKWFKLCLDCLESIGAKPKLCKRMSKFVELGKKEADDFGDFDSLYDKTLKYFKEIESSEEVDDSIANLALLDQNTNRSYKNAVFAVKRKRILALDQSGIIVPLCTRNVFLKAYSKRADNVMFWSGDDSDSYREKILDTLIDFFTV